MTDLPAPLSGRRRGTAELLESVRKNRDWNNHSDLVTIVGERLTGIPYTFLLRVTTGDEPPYQVAKADRVPAKAEDGGLLDGEIHLAPGIVVPVLVSETDPTDVEIDWDAYLAMPGRTGDAELARNRKSWAAQAAQFRRQPAKFQEQVLAGSRTAILSFAHLVVDGGMPRSQFDEEADLKLRTGNLRVEDYEEALAIIDAADAAPA